jgi:hypothetical protein
MFMFMLVDDANNETGPGTEHELEHELRSQNTED